MARIRSIKPEFWEDSKMAADLTRDQRLFYIALWNQADDEGRFPAHPRRLLGATFPYDRDLTESFIEDSLRVLGATHRVVLYDVEGEPYGELTKFKGHQRINRPTPSRIPAPDSDLASITEHSLNGHGANSEASRHPAHTRELELGARSREMEVDLERDVPDAKASSSDETPDAAVQQVYRHWLERTGRAPSRFQLTQKRRDVIRTRLKRFSVEELKQACDGVMLSEHHRSKLEYTDLDSFMRNDDRVENHIARALDPPSENGGDDEVDRFIRDLQADLK